MPWRNRLAFSALPCTFSPRLHHCEHVRKRLLASIKSTISCEASSLLIHLLSPKCLSPIRYLVYLPRHVTPLSFFWRDGVFETMPDASPVSPYRLSLLHDLSTGTCCNKPRCTSRGQYSFFQQSPEVGQYLPRGSFPPRTVRFALTSSSPSLQHIFQMNLTALVMAHSS